MVNSRGYQGFSLKAKWSSLRNWTIRWKCREIALQVLRALFWLFLFKGHIPFQYCDISVEKVTCGFTECRGFWKREGGQGDNENKSMGKTLFDVFFFFFFNNNGFKPISSTIICVWTKVRKCTFVQNHLRCRQWKGLNNQDFKKLFKQFSNSSNQTNTHYDLFHYYFS